ncbi:MAG: hypothetical protein ABI697_03390 [Devosia sp.]
MPSPTYDLFLRAMRDRQQVVCHYQGLRREICPVLLGRTRLEEKSLVFQFGGETSRGRVSPPGDWKCLRLDLVSDPVLQAGPWHAGTHHSMPQHCMRMVEYDANPQSPYDPAYRL